jgi:Dolichyl-phosphate-mannose-protein mannosyltransferase
MISSPIFTRPAGKISDRWARPESNQELWTALAVLTLLYVAVVSVANRRFVWFDELFTLDLAQAGTVQQMWQLIRKFDFQLPVGYLLSRISIKLIGHGSLGLRLPSMLEFYVGSMALFLYVRRKVGISYAIAAVLLLWLGQTFRYATEARPYALLLMFFSTLLLCWDSTKTSENRGLALWGVALSNLGMFTAHMFAPLSLFPFLAAEGFSFSRTRKTDFALWAGLLLPTVLIVSYLPAFHGYEKLYFPPEFQASLHKMAGFFHEAIVGISVALVMALSAALAMPQQRTQLRTGSGLRPEELVLFGCLLLNPIFLNAALMETHGAFWGRYAITTEAVIYIGMAMLLGIRLGNDRRAGYAAAAVLLLFCLAENVWLPLSHPSLRNASALASIRPDLPLVDAGGVTFFEMNHYENPDILSRLYFLKNRSLALSYTNTNLFEDRGFGDDMKAYFPIRAHIAAYTDFVREHHEFLVFGTYGAPEQWLLHKLHDDGARLTWLGSYSVPYTDSDLYLVNVTK